MSTHEENLERVSKRIGHLVAAFLRKRLESGKPDFFMRELVTFVQKSDFAVAPDSASRILRDLRQRSVVNYELLSRSASHYRALPPPNPKQARLPHVQ